MAVQWHQTENVRLILQRLADPDQKLDELDWDILRTIQQTLMSKRAQVLKYRDEERSDIQERMRQRLITVVDRIDRDFEQDMMTQMGEILELAGHPSGPRCARDYQQASPLFRNDEALKRTAFKVDEFLKPLFCAPGDEHATYLAGQASAYDHYGQVMKTMRDGGGPPVPPDIREMQTREIAHMAERREHFEGELKKLRGEIAAHKREFEEAQQASQAAFEELMAEESGAAAPPKKKGGKKRAQVPHPASAARAEPFRLHPRVTRWKEKVGSGSEQRGVSIRMRHHLPGTETLLDDSTYAFSTSTGYALLAKIIDDKGSQLGVLRFGIDNRVIYHRYFEPIEGSDLKTILGRPLEKISGSSTASAQEASLYELKNGENGVKIFTFPEESYSLEVYPL